MGSSIDSEQQRVLRLRDSLDRIVKFVRLGFHDCSLNFMVKLGRPHYLADVAEAAGPYNDFEPRRVVEAMAAVGDDLMTIEFGRDELPVLAADIPYWTHQRMGYDEDRSAGRMLSCEERREIALRTVQAFRQAGASVVCLFPGTRNLLDVPISAVQPNQPLRLLARWH